MDSEGPGRAPHRRRLVISGCGVISPIGIGVDEFFSGFNAGRQGRRRLAEGAATTPVDEACVIPEFDAARFLGPKGTRNMDRTTALAVAAAGMALRDRGVDLDACTDRIGVVLGTSTGSVKSAWDFTCQTLTQSRPYLVNPGAFPSTILNCAASQCAIWHKLRGVNATVAGGALSGTLGMRYAAVCLRQDYADLLLVGAAEEFSDAAAWGAAHVRSAASLRRQPPGEGSVFFALEPLPLAAPMRRGRAEVLANEVGVYSPPDENGDDTVDGLAECIRRALGRSDASPSDIAVISKRGSADGVLLEVEQRALDKALDGCTGARHIVIGDLIGETFSASSSFQLAALLASLERLDDEAPQYGLVSSVARDGVAGCTVVRRLGGR